MADTFSRLCRLTSTAEEWKPGNSSASKRHAGMPTVHPEPAPEYMTARRAIAAKRGQPVRWHTDESTGITPEFPPFVDPDTYVDHGLIFGPEYVRIRNKFGISVKTDRKLFDAQFNPTAFTAHDPVDGQEKVYMVIRGEKNVDDPNWKRRSLPYLAVSNDGIHFKRVSNEPIFLPSEAFELKGGIEDGRFYDLHLKPYRDPKTGKTYDSAILYTGFDGDTARIGGVVFNRANVHEMHKIGQIFDSQAVAKNPLVPEKPEWVKSPSGMQYYRPSDGRLVELGIAGEGNLHHGGIMMMEGDGPLSWQWPETRKPSIVAHSGTATHGLVEPAFRPFLSELPEWMRKKIKDTKGVDVQYGVVFCYHGDAPPIGYSVNYAILDPNHPTGAPLYESQSPFLWQTKKPPEEQVEKVNFASGAVVFKGRLFIYYGVGDSYIGAVSMKMNSLFKEPEDLRGH